MIISDYQCILLNVVMSGYIIYSITVIIMFWLTYFAKPSNTLSETLQ